VGFQKNNLLFSPTYSQIWLRSLVEHRKSAYLKKKVGGQKKNHGAIVVAIVLKYGHAFGNLTL
jgi:hypothetical protein